MVFFPTMHGVSRHNMAATMSSQVENQLSSDSKTEATGELELVTSNSDSEVVHVNQPPNPSSSISPSPPSSLRPPSEAASDRSSPEVYEDAISHVSEMVHENVGVETKNRETEGRPAPQPPVSNNVAADTTPSSNAQEKTTTGSVSSKNGESCNGEKNTKASVKSKKKEDKSIEHILRALNSLHTTEEKLAALCKKYADLHEEHRLLQSSHKQGQKKMGVLVREKEQLQLEHTKAVMAKGRLENLCRELQKHNKLVKEESLARAKEEDEKRKDISAKFQSTIGDIQSQMQSNYDCNVKLREENTELAGKLKIFIEQYEHREKHLEKVMQHREIEQQLADTKLKQSQLMLMEEQETSKKEKEVLILRLTESHKRIELLETQLAMYKDKYEDFQSTIGRSNDMFQKFKTEMDKMGKRIKKLEKEGAQWKAKWETAQKNLIDMAQVKTITDKEKSVLQTKVQKLESLCRALQAERQGRTTLDLVQTISADCTTDTSGKTPSTATDDNRKRTVESTPPDSGEQTTNGDNPRVSLENRNDDDGSSDGAPQLPQTPDHESHPDDAQTESSSPLATAQTDSTSAEQVPISPSETDGADKATEEIPVSEECQPVSSKVSSNDDKSCTETNATDGDKQQSMSAESTADQSIHLNGQPDHEPDKEPENSAECHNSLADSVSDTG